ncbi:hypothetical protein BJV82DRAFT_690410 [Fennellomyces sp. T-0311]|nr:hypothetical protein BJV82DRAFT_690410 [Fennellomyces sp. T-0311]
MKEAIIKHGVQHVLTPYRPKAPGSDLEANAQQQQPRRYFWQKKQDPWHLLTPHEKKVLTKVKARAHLLDKGFNCCCCQIGLDPIIGLIPVIGDFAGLLLALYMVQSAAQVQLPQSVLSQMMMNIAIDFLIGLVPIVGDLMDVMYKCNTRNAILLENHLNKRQAKRLKQQEEGSSQEHPLLSEQLAEEPSSSSSHHPPSPAYEMQRPQPSKNPHHY